MKLPIKLTLELVASDGDIQLFKLAFAVPGSAASMTTANITVRPDAAPAMAEAGGRGLTALGDALRDRFLVAMAKLAYGAMIDNDGTAIEWWVSDITRFLSRRFEPHDAAVVAGLLGTFVNPPTPVEDVSVVRID
ncbi:MAG TPA: hypothetical protein VK324_04360 [Tepidisphaeraceae bacterium]|nr:hypothetical protein [Tepidisphaeraceae bacterium]